VIELVLRITLSLLIVLGLMWGLARLAKRPLARRGGGVLDVLSRQQLSRTSSVAVIRVADRALIVGITDTQISLLGEADLAAVERQLAEPGERRAAVPLDPTTPAPTIVPGLGLEQPGRLDGSVLSPKTWRSLADFLRERTARR
jgi:flagellar protein FliO/FliZ